jgi:hypothetical protein
MSYWNKPDLAADSREILSKFQDLIPVPGSSFTPA